MLLLPLLSLLLLVLFFFFSSASVEAAAEGILQPFYTRLHGAGIPAESIPSELALGFTPHGRRSAKEEVRRI